jgi:hypothetical protein
LSWTKRLLEAIPAGLGVYLAYPNNRPPTVDDA